MIINLQVYIWVIKKVTGYRYTEQTGEHLSVEGTYDDTAGLVINGDSRQTATEQGKNLLDKAKIEDIFKTLRQVEYLQVDDRSCASLKPDPTYRFIPVKIKENTVYSISFYTRFIDASLYLRMRFYYSDDTSSSSGTLNNIDDWERKEFTSAEGKTLVGMGFVSSSNGYRFYIDIDTIQFELGSTATPYEPFTPNSPSPDYPSYPKSVGDNGGFDLVVAGNAGQLQTTHFPYALRSTPNGTRDKIIIDHKAKNSNIKGRNGQNCPYKHQPNNRARG